MWLFIHDNITKSYIHLCFSKISPRVFNYVDQCIYLELGSSFDCISGGNGFAVSDKLNGFYRRLLKCVEFMLEWESVDSAPFI